MTRRSKVWLTVAVLFIVVNVAGGVFAAAQGELLHTGIHAGLAYLMWRLALRRDASAPPRELTDRLAHLEQSIDAIAIEVERIGEGQRFLTRVLTENDTSRAPGEGGAEPIESRGREAAPHVRRS